MAGNNTTSNSRNSCVALVRFSALGDVAMTVPVVYSAALANPGIQFIFITRSGFNRIFINSPQNLITLGIDLKTQFKGPAGMIKLARRLKKEYGVDTLIDLHDVLRTKILRVACRLQGIKVSVINKGRSEKKALTRKKNKIFAPLTPTVTRYRIAVENAGINVENRFSSLFHNNPASPQLYSRATAPKQQGERWIAIAPFAKHSGKIYPLQKMKEVAATLAAQPNTKLFLFGGGEIEEKELSRWANELPSTTSLAGMKLGFGGELALLSQMDAVVSMDSANMHLASLAGAPVVSVWGATHPYAGFYGWQQSPENAVQLPLPCRPCSVFGNKPCLFANYKCLAGIEPSVIIKKVNSLLPPTYAS